MCDCVCAKSPAIRRRLPLYEAATHSPHTRHAYSAEPGVTVMPVQSVAFGAFEEKIVFLALGAQNAQDGAFVSVLKASSSTESGQAPLFLRVGNAPPLNLNVVVSPVFYTFANSSTVARFFLNVTSLEPQPLRIGARVDNLPANWSATVSPQTQLLFPGASGLFNFTVTIPNSALQDANLTVVLTSEDGREKPVPVAVNARQAASGATGFFTLAFLGDPLAIALLILLLIAGIGLALFSKGLLERASSLEQGRK